MRIIGIDYGSQKVGIALSDETNVFALPYLVLPRNSELLKDVCDIVRLNNVGEIILGESKDFSGADNPIMKKIEAFKTDLEHQSGKAVIYEPEFLTSRHARQVQGENAMHDASAAALILQSFLDRRIQSQKSDKEAAVEI